MIEAIDKLEITDNMAKKFKNIIGVNNPKAKDLKKYLKKNYKEIFIKVD